MIGAGMSPEAQYQLAMKMPEASLANILKGIPGDIDQSVAMMVLSQRRKMKTAAQGQQAAKQAEEPSVKDRMLQSQQAQLPENQGIGTLPSPNMGQVAAMAQGGVVGFLEGGGTGTSYRDTMNWLRNQWNRPRGFVVDPLSLDPESNIPATLSNITPETSAPPAAPAAAPAARTAPPASAPQAGINMLPRSPEEVAASASLSDAAPLTQDQVQARMTGSPTAALPAAGINTLMPPAAAPARVPASKVYSDQMTEALKALTATPEEKDKQKDERLGVMALQAASALLQPGTTGAGARSAVFGKMATLTQQYGKEDREDKRAAIGAKISVLGAQMNNANQQEQNAITLENHAGDTVFRYADLAGKEAQRKEEAKIGWAKLSNEEKKLKLDEVYRTAHLQVMRDQTKSQEKVGMARVGALAAGRTNLTPAQYAAASAKAATAIDKRLATPGELFNIRKDPAFKDFTNTQIRDALIASEMRRSMPGAEVGSGVGTPPTKVQYAQPGKLSAASDPDLED